MVINTFKPLFIMLPETSRYVKLFYETKCISFFIEDKEFLRTYNEKDFKRI